VSIDVNVIGSESQELETLLRGAGIRATTAPEKELLRLVQPGTPAPAVVVLDVRRQGTLPAALPLLKKEHPSTGVVIVAEKLDPALMLEAMRAGVTEWVVDPVTVAELVPAVERAGGMKAAPTAGEIFAIVGAKGGVGATTVAVNVATTLSSVAKGRTLIIDLHPAGGDTALFLGAEPSFSTNDALDNTHRLDEAFLKGLVVKTPAGPDLLASPDRALASAVDPSRLRTVVDFASRCYQYVILDVPRGAAAFDSVLELATSITVVTTQELAAIRAASRLAAALRQRQGGDRIRVVINRYDRSAEIGSQDLERAVGGQIGHRFPSNYRLAIDALNTGRPIVVDNHNKLAASFASYARALPTATAPTAETAAAPAAGLLGRFTRRR
jgi:pilus assembly protein CpaE